MSAVARPPVEQREQFMVKVNGKSFRCACGCNVFHKEDAENAPEEYTCNCCDALYRGEP